MTADARPVREGRAPGGQYGSMSAVPAVAHWWRGRSDSERLDLYTRSSYYGAIGFTTLLATLGLLGETWDGQALDTAGAWAAAPPVLAVLAGWLVGSALLARRLFRWAPRR